MTDLAALLAKLRELDGKAKKGPWKGAETRRGIPSGWMYCDMGDAIWVSDADSNFIATARNVMGLLLDVVDMAAQVAGGADSELESERQHAALTATLSRLAAAEVGP